ncbi:MAG TPA: hypothetical protein DIW17_11035 [Clostridiales bacterium]|nr:hypothetical protein [Clostridiales bacterium]
MNEQAGEAILNAIFSSIFDQVTIYKIVEDEKGFPVNFILEKVNDAYLSVNKLKREEIVGRLYTEIWEYEEERGFFNLMLRVARAGIQNLPYDQRLVSNYFEGTSSMVPGVYYQTFAFIPYPGKIVVILKDMSDWYHLTFSLKEKENLLLKYREDLRKLTARLTLAEEKTKRSLAMVLHDRIGFSMVNMANTLREIEKNQSDERLKQNVKNVVMDMEKLIKEIRTFTFEISPTLLYEVGIEAAFEVLCEEMFTRHKIKYSISSSGRDKDIAEDIKILLFHMVRELFVNIIKHAKATAVSIKMRRGSKKYQIVVEDNGVGFCPSDENDFRDLRGIGLFSIRERLTTLGGQISIVSEPNKGTIVSIIAPINIKENNEKSDERTSSKEIKKDEITTFLLSVKNQRRAF